MWVKICGIHDVSTAREIADLAPDAIGLNFHPPSPRFVDVQMAERIVRSLPAAVEPVGVFVNRPAGEIAEIARHVRLATVQLHGDEPAECARSLVEAGLNVIRALRIDPATVHSLPDWVDLYAAIPLRGVLIDARVAGQFGGSGQTAPWQSLAAQWKPDWPPLILAGGLTPLNVNAGIAATSPWGVDTASGVESSTGIKDLELARRFIVEARRSL